MLYIDPKLIAKLPKYAQKWQWLQLERSFMGGRLIDALCEPLPDDEERDQVAFTCDNFTEFLWWVRQYHKTRRRMN